MKDLLTFTLNGILGNDDFSIEEAEENGRIVFTIRTNPSQLGLIIGKGGKVIKSLRNILKVRATLEKKAVTLNIAE